ncbi:MAG: hypothetical protein ACOH16_12040 [Propionibacteriaceae bacterium]
MSVTTPASTPSAAMQSLDPLVVQAFTALRAAVKACEDADNAQAQRGAEQAHDRYDGMCVHDAENAFLAKGRAIVDRMWASFGSLQDGYQSSLRPHENVGPMLHQVYLDTWGKVAAAVDPIISDVETRLQQEHWTGAGAADYMKQLPVQLSALNEFTAYAGVAGAGVETPALLQQSVFSSEITMLGRATSQVQGYAGTDTGDTYFQRCAWADSVLSQCVDWFTDDLMTGTGTWKPILDDHVRRITSGPVTNATVLTGDSWPKATSATDTSKLPSGTDSKYTSPTGLDMAGSSAPVTDRGDGGVQITDVAG